MSKEAKKGRLDNLALIRHLTSEDDFWYGCHVTHDVKATPSIFVQKDLVVSELQPRFRNEIVKKERKINYFENKKYQ